MLRVISPQHVASLILSMARKVTVILWLAATTS